jgi:hypothetical protein
MDDADITALAEQVGLTDSVDDIVAWARERTDAVLGGALDDDLVALLEGRPLVALPTEGPRPARTETQPSPPRTHEPSVGPNTAVGLPPVPQRPDLAARAPHDSADDLEMLDEEDLELMEELAEDAGDEAPADPAAAMSSPEWKRALADAQGE